MTTLESGQDSLNKVCLHINILYLERIKLKYLSNIWDRIVLDLVWHNVGIFVNIVIAHSQELHVHNISVKNLTFILFVLDMTALICFLRGWLVSYFNVHHEYSFWLARWEIFWSFRCLLYYFLPLLVCVFLFYLFVSFVTHFVFDLCKSSLFKWK